MAIDVLLVGGGTGGHVLPAIATAEAISRRRPELRIAFAGLADSIEERLVTSAGYELEHLTAVPLPRRLTPALLAVPLRLARAVRAARTLLRTEQVRVVVVFGGYVSLPVALAAKGRVPLVVHEQNSRPGLANRRAARWAEHVAVSFPSSMTRFPDPSRCRYTGDPVREQLRDLDRVGLRAEARERLGLEPDRRTLLVFGGSQGARSINRAVTRAAADWRRLGLQVLHVAGARGVDEAMEAWRWVGVEPNVPGSGVALVGYLADMSDAYAAADAVVCRAGATSIAELTVLGLPAVLVPYPHATADHQQANADALAAVGAARVVTDDELGGDRLVGEVEAVLGDSAVAAAMSAASRAWGRPEAADAVAALALAPLDAEPVGQVQRR